MAILLVIHPQFSGVLRVLVGLVSCSLDVHFNNNGLLFTMQTTNTATIKYQIKKQTLEYNCNCLVITKHRHTTESYRGAAKFQTSTVQPR